VALPEGTRVEIRTAETAHVKGILAIEADQLETDPHRVRDADEGIRSAAAWDAYLKEHAREPSWLFLVAVAGLGRERGGEVVGRLAFRCDQWRKTRHHGTFGIVVHSAWRGRGVGSALIESLLDWGAAHPELEKIRLSVFATNVGARRLYRRLGFRSEGRFRRHFRMPDGRVLDDVSMAIYVKPGIAPAGFVTWREGATGA
jgi:RimJ/RimL family protein N-acetyltransferase